MCRSIFYASLPDNLEKPPPLLFTLSSLFFSFFIVKSKRKLRIGNTIGLYVNLKLELIFKKNLHNGRKIDDDRGKKKMKKKGKQLDKVEHHNGVSRTFNER